MDYQQIYNIRQQHLDLSDEDFVTWANTPVLVSTAASLPVGVFNDYLYRSQLYARIELAKFSGVQALAGLAYTATAYLQSPQTSMVVWNDDLMQTCLGGFVAAGVFTQQEVDDAKKTLTETWAAPFAGLTADDLTLAMRSVPLTILRQQLANCYNTAVSRLDAVANDPTADIPTLATLLGV